MIDTISIMSCDRDPSYLNDTISSIPSNFNIELFYQGDISKLKFDNIKIFQIRFVDDRSLVHRNSQFNYASILLRTKCGFIVEDDIFFSQNFNTHIENIYESLRNRELIETSEYAVALYSCYNWGREDVDLIDYPSDGFYGTQAMIYSLKTAREFGHFLMGRIGKEPYDLALKSFLSENPGTSLFASTRSLVQHIGQSTSGLGFFHQAPNFVN